MDYTLLLQNLEESILPYLTDEQAKFVFLEQVRQLKKGFKGSEFKLKRTIRDKQITTNVLESTITELKIQSENLKHQKLLTEEHAKFKEQLFANVSHELRTPLHGIIGMSHLLRKTSLDKEQKKYIKIVKNSADNLLIIINDLLNLSKINAGKTVIINEPFSIKKLYHDLRDLLEFKAKNKKLNLQFFMPPNLPEYLMGDQTRLYQILLNLLNNAIKFTNKGTISLNIYVLSKSKEKINLQFEIKDTGIGIEQSKLDFIFGIFTQIEVKKGDTYEGVGLGLNIVKNLINLMDGVIKVKSIPHKGSIFSVNLPFTIPSPETIQDFKKTNFKLIIPPHWQYKNILLIEDNEANLVYAENIFANWNIELEVAKTLKEAQEKITNQLFDCILSDIKLPDGNGMDLIAKLRSDDTSINQQTAIIVLTASANEKEESYAKKLNVQSYIGKPFPPELLVQEMKKILDLPFEIKPIKKVSIEEKKHSKAQLYFKQLEKNFSKKPKLQIELFDIFLKQFSKAIKNMEKGLNENDLSLFHYEAHRIKSTINIIGLPKLQPLIAKIDEYCYKKINLEQLPILYEQFKEQGGKDVELVIKRKESLLVIK